MRVFAYCAQSFERATRKAAGVIPVTSPPCTVETFDLAWLARQDFVYFDLHGEPEAAQWYGEPADFPGSRTVAMAAGRLRQADLRGAVVFAVNCFLGDAGSPMLDALLAAGASYVIAGDGKNWAGASEALFGASLLGAWVRRLLGWGYDAPAALHMAKLRLELTLFRDRMLNLAGRTAAARDTLAFRIYERKVAT